MRSGIRGGSFLDRCKREEHPRFSLSLNFRPIFLLFKSPSSISRYVTRDDTQFDDFSNSSYKIEKYEVGNFILASWNFN